MCGLVVARKETTCECLHGLSADVHVELVVDVPTQMTLRTWGIRIIIRITITIIIRRMIRIIRRRMIRIRIRILHFNYNYQYYGSIEDM